MYSVVLMMALSQADAGPAQYEAANRPKFGNQIELTHVKNRHRRNGGCCGGCYGCYGGCWGSCYGGCYGCWGSCYGGACYGVYTSGYANPQTSYAIKNGSPSMNVEGTPLSRASGAARIIVTLPADAKLTVDGSPTTSTSATRVFVTPDLELGREHHYILAAEVVRDGQPVRTSKRITVRAGQETRIQIDLSPGTVAAR
jgi:uncharacterized protein (TIGR03000 family)